MTRTKTPLEMAAMLIVLESSNKVTRSSAGKAYVRQALIGELEQALRELGWDMDTAFAHVLDAKKKERKESIERQRIIGNEQEKEEDRRAIERQAARAAKRKGAGCIA